MSVMSTVDIIFQESNNYEFYVNNCSLACEKCRSCIKAQCNISEEMMDVRI